MNLSQKEKELLIRALSHYYTHHVWSTMAREDNGKASEEDYAIRHLTEKLEIRSMFPDYIKMGW